MNILQLLTPGLGAAAALASGLAMAPAPAAADAAAPRYVIRNLGRLPRAATVEAVDINNRGEVAGNAYLWGTPGHQTVFLYGGGGMVDLLAGQDGFQGGTARALNELGQVAGAVSLRGPGGPTHAAILSRGGVNDLAPLLGEREAVAVGLGERGQVAGNFFGGIPFLYDGSRLHLINDEGPPLEGAAVAMNDAGAVLLLGSRDDGTGGSVGMVYRDGRFTVIDIPEPYANHVAINDAGQVAGYGAHSFLWSDGRYQVLEDPPGWSGQATDLNSQGWVVGGLSRLDHVPGSFLYRDGTMYALDELLLPYGAAHWQRLRATGINDAGQIVGTGIYDGRYQRSFVATPVPEPAGCALMLAGLGALGWAVRRRRAGA